MARRRSKFINNSPYFFKVVLAPANQGLMIPISFMDKYGGSLTSSTAVVLKVPMTGASSTVQLRRTDTGTWLGQGWEDFGSYYGIKLCDFVVFRYAGNSEFDVTIFDERATQIQYPGESSEEEDSVVEILEPGKTNKRQKNVLTLASSSSESSEEEDVEMSEPPQRTKNVQKNASFSFDLSEEDDVEMNEAPGPAIRKQSKLNKVQKNKVELALSSSEDEDVEIYEPSVTVIRKQRNANILLHKNKVRLETASREKREANRMQKNKLRSEEEGVEILEHMGSANSKPREENKMQKSKLKLASSSSSESSEEEDVEIYEPLTIRKQRRAYIMLEEDSENDEPAFPKQRNIANKMQKDKLKSASSLTGKQRTAGKMVGTDKKKEYMSYKRAEDFTSENPFFLVFMQPSYIANRFILSFNLTSAGNVFPENASSCKMQVRVPGRHSKVWELSCNMYWKHKRANVLSGWKYFAVDNNLGVGDVCVFELVEANLMDFNITIFRK